MQKNIRDGSLLYIFYTNQVEQFLPLRKVIQHPPSSSLPPYLRKAQFFIIMYWAIRMGDMGVPDYTEGIWTIPRWNYFQSS